MKRGKKRIKRVVIRKAGVEDIEKMWKIDQVCFDQDIAYTPDIFFYHMLIKCDPAFVAMDGGAVVGFVLTSRENSKTGIIVTIDVLPEQRMSGIGTSLMDRAEKAQADLGVKTISLQTPVDNEGAISFYLKRAYEKHGLVRGYYGSGRDAFLFIKNIV